MNPVLRVKRDCIYVLAIFALGSLVAVSGCESTAGSPMLWAIDSAGFIRPRDQYLKTHYTTEADVVTISLNTLYLKYLKPELLDHNYQLLVYTEVYDSPEAKDPYRTVVYNNEINEDTVLGVVDRVIYGPIKFKGHPIRLLTFVVELDKQDNEKAAKILQAIGSAVSAAQPTAAPAVSTGLSVGKVLMSFNEDDYELRADITFHPGNPSPGDYASYVTPEDVGVAKEELEGDRTAEYPQTRNMLQAPLRSGHYLLTKVEHASRGIADLLSKKREYLAAQYFTDENDDEAILVYKSGYLWRDAYAYDDAGEKGVDETEFYDEKTYAVFAISHGGREADEAKMRAVASEQFDQVSGLLQGDTSEQVIENIQAVGQRVAATARAHHIMSAQNHKVKNNPAYREDPDFILGFVDRLIGEEPVPGPGSPADENYGRDLNAALLRAIESSVRGFPLSSDLDAVSWDKIKAVKSEAAQKISHIEDSEGVFRWGSQS